MSRHNFELISLGLIDLAKMKLDAMMAYIAHTGNDGISAVWMQTGRVTFLVLCINIGCLEKRNLECHLDHERSTEGSIVISPTELRGL